jgi:hypothetical protein
VSVVPAFGLSYAADPLPRASVAVAVGQNSRATIASGSPAPLFPCFAESFACLARHASVSSVSFGLLALGVGQSVAASVMRGAHPAARALAD